MVFPQIGQKPLPLYFGYPLAMLKFLLILALSLYILSKIGSFIFRGGAASHQFRPNQRRPSDGKLHVDTPPRKEKKPNNFKGGDYVDYEEVK